MFQLYSKYDGWLQNSIFIIFEKKTSKEKVWCNELSVVTSLTSIELLGTQTKTKERLNTKTTSRIKHKTTVHYQPNPRLLVSMMMINLLIWNMCSRPNNHSLFAFGAASNNYIKLFVSLCCSCSGIWELFLSKNMYFNWFYNKP